MSFARRLERHRRSVFFVAALCVVAGISALSQSPVALFPHVNFPRIVVTVDAGDRPAERMAIQVTRPIEEELRGVLGVRSVRSATSRGTADVSVSFDWGQDMVSALLLVESAMARLTPTLPPGTQFEARRMDPTVFPALGYSLTSDTRSATELYELAEYDLRPMLATVPGVSHASVLGGRPRELRVTLSEGQLRAYGLTVDDVATALSSSNLIVAAGRLEDLHHLYLVTVEAQARDLGALAEIVLRAGPEGVVHLDDVASISSASVPQWTRVVADGHEAVLLQVYQQPDGNTVGIAEQVRALLRQREASLPADVRISTWYDQSELIVASEHSVRDAVLVGVLLACLVILVFLRDLRITLTALVIVPSVLATTALILYALGQSLNIMTLGGMAAAVGLVIDDVIVVVEHIATRRGHVGPLEAAAEFTRPLVISSSVTVIVFAPLAFLSGVTGAFFAALAVTMASALLISFAMAWLVVPLIAERLVAGGGGAHESSEGGLMRGYRRLLGWVVAHPLATSVAVLPLLGIGYVAYTAVGSEFMPVTDEGGFILDYRAAPGSSLTETDRLCRQVEEILAETPEVAAYSRRTGLQLGGSLTEANEGDYFIRLHSGPRRAIDEIMSDVRSRIRTHVPGLEIEMAQLMEDLIGDLTAVPQPIEVIVYSNDPSVLVSSAHRVAEAISSVSGVVDVNDGIKPAGDGLVVEVDLARAALEGLSPEAISTAASAQLRGVVATEVQRGVQMVGVRAWTSANRRSRIGDVEALRIRAPDGHLVRLGRVARVTRISGEPQIARDDLRRMVAVTGRIEGRDMGSVVADVRGVLSRPDVIGPRSSYRLGGLYAQQQKAFLGLMAVFGAAVALVFLVLLISFERFRVAACMLLVALFAMCAVVVGLWLTDTPLNISSMMGMTMVIGIVTEVGVFYVTETARPADVPLQRALMDAGVARSRPILMTSVAAILALLPLALAIGEGSSMLQPLAVAIISGLVAQIPLTLLVLPALMKLTRARPLNARVPSTVSGQAEG
ncbi:MAG: efflux RND transporter permease subunit [Deltaproteobacteria bacterium]|nr:efflux RND transporter permease subunit [Deltaproteobacteria bacterium]